MFSLSGNPTRRSFLFGAGAGLAVSMAGLQNAVAQGVGGARLFRPASNESLFVPSRWQKDDLLKCSFLFRDVADGGQAALVDPGLIDIIVRLSVAAEQVAGRSCRISVNSAFRTRLHNARLEGAAKASLHLKARALDFTIQGFENLAVAKLSAMVGAGGIGVYKNFTHIDSGQDRTWVVSRIN